MGYAHEVIVDDVCKVISRQTVALYEHLIVKSRVFNGDIAEDLVVERGAALPGIFWRTTNGSPAAAFASLSSRLRQRQGSAAFSKPSVSSCFSQKQR